MKIGDKIFMFGKAPSKKATYIQSYPHPKDTSMMVKFVKHPEKRDLYVNIKDLIAPFEKHKKYARVLKKMFPRGKRDLNQVWINTRAWTIIKQSIDNNMNLKEIIAGWKEKDLF